LSFLSSFSFFSSFFSFPSSLSSSWINDKTILS
jgi:hypothetical protein